MTSFAEQVANAYAIAKVLGSELSVQEFQKEYSYHLDEAISVLNSDSQLAQCEAVQRPY